MFYEWLAVTIVMICIIPFECTVAFQLAREQQMRVSVGAQGTLH